MTARDELEAILRERPDDRATLAVYADMLQAAGDVRGELIAVELELERTPDARHLTHRRDALLKSWLQLSPARMSPITRFATIPALVLSPATNYGVSMLTKLFKRAGDHICAIMFDGQVTDLGGAIELIVAGPRRALGCLDIEVTGFEKLRGHAVTRGQTADLIAVTPHLTDLRIEGAPVFERFDHPTVDTLAVTTEAITDLSSPAVTTLDLLMRAERDIALPNLVNLFLDRSEPDVYAAKTVHAFPTTIPHPDRLRALSLPSIRTADDLARAQASLDALPALERVILHRDHAGFGNLAARLHHPRARIELPELWPWPPREIVEFTLEAFDDPNDLIPIDDVIPELEAQWATMTPAARAAWTELWRALVWGDDALDVSTATLRTALDGVVIQEPALLRYRELMHARAAELPPRTRIAPAF